MVHKLRLWIFRLWSCHAIQHNSDESRNLFHFQHATGIVDVQHGQVSFKNLVSYLQMKNSYFKSVDGLSLQPQSQHEALGFSFFKT